MKRKVFLVLLFVGFPIVLFSNPKPTKLESTEDPFIVVLDAGHGGHDPGNLGNGYLEKKIALNIVLKVGEILSKNKDIKVIYTRKDDTFIDLYVRGEIANKANADLFVSVHCDSHTSNASGAGTFVLGLHANEQNFQIAKKENSVIYLEDNYENRYANYDINSPESVIGLTIMQEEFLDQSIALAKLIQDNFSKKLKRTDRKVKQAGFIVLHQTFMPSVLVETGFLTNKEEGVYLNSKKGQSEMGKAIAEAILSYKKGVKPESLELDKGLASSNPTKTTNTSSVPIVANNKPKVIENEIDKGNAVVNTENTSSEAAVSATKTEEEIFAENRRNAIEEIKKNLKAKERREQMAGVTFKVQFLATTKNVPLVSKNFKGLTKLTKEPYKNLYRYMHGQTNSYTEAKRLQNIAKEKGYATSFVVAYRLGERISLKEALKQVSE